jgi:hypothetical protein
MLSDAIKPTMTTDEAHYSVIESLHVHVCFMRTLSDSPVPVIYPLTVLLAEGAQI